MKKKFDAVQLQRQIREELSTKYSRNRVTFLRILKEKYGALRKSRPGTAVPTKRHAEIATLNV